MTVNPMGTGAVTYDAENRIVNTGGADYYYGDGNRILGVMDSVTGYPNKDLKDGAKDIKDKLR